jgi:large subunit ribosomal protein L2
MLTAGKPEKSLLVKGIFKRQGKNNTGRITVRHRGGGVKRKMRVIDWKRGKREVMALVNTIEYDPMRSANIALVTYKDGEKCYILAPEGMKVGDSIMAGAHPELKPGNAMPLSQIPVGVPIHNIEMKPGQGAQLIRSAGTAALIQSKEGKFATVQLPSREVRLIPVEAYATIGQVGNVEWKTMSLGKAGRRRLMGWRPEVRGVAMHPNNHPHGGGEGRSGIGLKAPKSPWGKRLGKKTRSRRKFTNKFIVKDRRLR